MNTIIGEMRLSWMICVFKRETYARRIYDHSTAISFQSKMPSDLPFAFQWCGDPLGWAQFQWLRWPERVCSFLFNEKQNPLSNSSNNESAFFAFNVWRTISVVLCCRWNDLIVLFWCLFALNDSKSNACRRALYFHLFCFAFFSFSFKSIRSDAKKNANHHHCEPMDGRTDGQKKENK